MKRKLIIDGNAVYEIDENCMLSRKIEAGKKESSKNVCLEEYKKTLKRDGRTR